jgi:CheY-like chemotaxis protein
MSHELRTPLNAILGFSQLMEGDRNLTAEQQENLGIINRSGEHLLGLINDVLDMSKIEAGRMTLQEVSLDLDQLLDGLEGMFRLRSESKGLTFTLRKAEDMPRYVVADEGKLRQVLSNLLGNAVKFTQKGSVALRIRVPCWTGAGDREMLCFEIEDTGPGIAPEELETVFDPFVQATGGATMSARQIQEGTGLGLAISRQFALLMGGDITVDSELDHGSLFRLEVPLRRADSGEVRIAGPRPKVRGLAPGQRADDGKPYRLLIVEDRVTNRRLLVKLLADLGEPPDGFEIREASNGQEAIGIWAAWQPHLIWMDMRMPVMDGCEATRRIKTRPGGKETTIIALTATAFEEDRDRILLEGCDDFLRKPFRKEEIFDMLSKYLGVRFVYEEEPAQPAAPEPEQVRREPEAVKAADVAALPVVWTSELREATIRADLDRIQRLVEEIRSQNPSLADRLLGLADNFEYQQILDLLEETGG